ncbi:MAG TPA: hypothetical protein VND94_18865 [Terriglobia bacterium]|nr:hypothetical protein [Terriglobia bacterium]
MLRNKLETPLESATRATRTLIDLLGQDLPSYIWDDPFVLGFIYQAATAYAIQAGVAGDQLHYLSAMYLDLFEGDAEDILSRSAALHLSKDASFHHGSSNARRFIGAMGRTPASKDDATAIEANRQAQEAMLIADSSAPLTYNEALYIYLYDGLFASELRKRFPNLVERSG